MLQLIKRVVSKICFEIRRLFIVKGIIRKNCQLIAGQKITFREVHKSNILKQIALNGIYSYEPELNLFLRKYSFAIKTFIDAGANIGYYSIIANIIFESSVNVLAIEPFPDNVKYMERLKKENGLTFDILPHALSSESGNKVSLFFPVGETSSRLAASASLVNSFAGTGGIYNHLDFSVVEVTTTTLRDVLAKSSPPYLVKLDCEGHELPILKTVKEDLQNRDDIDFVIEIMINDEDKQEVFELMIACGYEGYLVTNAGLVAEERPLTLPYYDSQRRPARTCWKNHYFTKRSKDKIKTMSKNVYGYFI